MMSDTEKDTKREKQLKKQKELKKEKPVKVKKQKTTEREEQKYSLRDAENHRAADSKISADRMAKNRKLEKMLKKEEQKRQRAIMKEKVKQYDGGFSARCVALLLGFIFGIVGTIGGIGGVGYYVVKNKTIKEISGVAGDKFNIDDFLSPEYTEKTLLSFFKEFGDLSAKLTAAEVSIAALAEISPYVNKVADKLTERLTDFGIDVDTEALKSTPLNKISGFLQETIQNTKLGTLIGAKPDGSIMALLCFGEEGVNYTLDAEGNISWIGDSRELQIKDFMDNGATSGLFNRLSLKAVMETTGKINTNDPITRVLVYGTKDVDYTTETDPSTGEEAITWLPVAYSYDTDTDALADDHGKTITFKRIYDSSTQSISLFDSDTPAEDAVPYLYLHQDDTDLKWYAYSSEEDLALAIANDDEAKSKRVLHRSTTFNDILKGNFMEMVEGVEIASLLNVTADSEGTLLSLAYGNENEDYKIESDASGNKTIVCINGAKPRTIKSLRNGELSFETMELGSLLKIKPHSSSNETMVNLAYGEEGKHYIYDDATEKFTWLNKQYLEKLDSQAQLALFDSNGNKIEGATKNGSAWSWTENEITYQTTAAGTLGNHTYYAYKQGDPNKTPITYKARTIKDLTNMPTTELVSGSSLESLLNVNADTDAVLRSIAYGRQDVNYRLNTVSDGASESKKVVEMLPVKYSFDGTEWKNEHGKTLAAENVQDLGDGKYEFLVTLDGSVSYAYVQNVSAAGEYPITDAFGTALTYKKRSINSLKSNNATELFNEIELRSVLPENVSETINLYLLYGKKGVDYEIVDGKVQMKDGKSPKTIGDLRATGENSVFSKLREDLTIGDILGDVSGNKILESIQGSTLNSLGADIKKLTIGQIVENVDDNNILKNLKGSTIDSLSEDIKKLTIGQIVENVDDNKILKNLKNSTMDSLNTDIQALTLEQILGEDEVNGNKILSSLGSSTLDTLNEDIQNLRVSDIFDNVDNNKLLKPLKDVKITELSAKIEELKIVEVFEDEIYYKNADGAFTDENGNVVDETNKVMKGEWVYLLTDPTGAKNPSDYTIQNIGSLTENMKENIKTSSIIKINKDFNLEINTDSGSFLTYSLSESNLNSLVAAGKITSERKDALIGKVLGDLTIKELFDYLPTMFLTIPTIPTVPYS